MTRVLLAALLAGLCAGLFMSAVQYWRVTPLILAAEKFETATAASEGAAHDHGHDHAGHWKPADGVERTTFTVLTNVISAVAFALVLAAVAVLTGLPVTTSNGLVWGFCGFLVFSLIPASGLAPELPGMPAGELAARQVWWWAAAVCTGTAIIIATLWRTLPVWLIALVLVALPHIIGAPQPDGHDSAVPAGLAAAFAANALAVAALFWLALGALLAWFINRLAPDEATAP